MCLSEKKQSYLKGKLKQELSAGVRGCSSLTLDQGWLDGWPVADFYFGGSLSLGSWQRCYKPRRQGTSGDLTWEVFRKLVDSREGIV